MKRNVKIGIAAAILFVGGMAYRSHVNARFGRGLLVGGAIANRDRDSDNGNAGAALGTAAILGTAGAIGRAARDGDRHDDNNGRSRQSRKNR